jgi:hypothetical protein
MKTQRIFIRVSVETKNKIAEQAKEYKTTISDYILTLVENRKMKVQATPDPETIEIKKELHKIRKHLLKIANFHKELKVSEQIILRRQSGQLRDMITVINKYYDR